jgi:transposase
MRQRGISYDDCRSRYNVGCSTITLIMNRFKESGKDLDSLKEMSAEEVEQLFFPPENLRKKDSSVMPDYQAVYDRLNAPGSKANLFYLWLKYKKGCPSGYQYTQYCEYFKRFVNKRYGTEAVSMVVERIPGEKVYIDWIGDQPEILVDSFTGEIRKIHFFVTTVGVSNLVYAEAFEDEKLPNFIAGTVHALESYGAVPKYLVPDNLKTAITRHTKDELVINSAYQDLESFYDVIILPPPPRKPKGKPTVEKYVQFLETHLLEDLKEKVYYNIEDINHDVWQKIEAINNEKKTEQSLSKMESFLRYDKPQMKPLAGESFSLCDYKYFAHVPNNYHLLYDDHYYSVLYTYYNQPAILKATMSEIRICDRNNKLICTHRRSYADYPKYITKQEHMAPHHQYYKEVNSKDGAYYRRWASSIGPYTGKLIDAVLLAPQHEEQAYNSCNGILHMCKNQPRLIVEEISKTCVESNACRYSYFKKLLKNRQDDNTMSPSSSTLPEHSNLRGKEEYR